jgi:outer membrane protein OmpA-like peptidoglycan-associated protein
MKVAFSSLQILMLLLLTAGYTWAEQGKSAAEILRGLGGERGAGEGAPPSGGRAGAKVDLQIQFEYNSAKLTAQAVAQLDALATALNDAALASSRFRIEGHTDSTGSPASNLVLSERRAQAVEQFLTEHGQVDPSRLQVKGYGQSRPIAPETTEEDRALNRRVAVVNLGTSGPAKPETKAKAKVVQKTPAQQVAEKPQVEVKPTAETPAQQAPSGRPSVDVVVRYEHDGQANQLKPGTVLRPVDNYMVSFTPSTKAYVYVLQFDASGNASKVFPNPEHSSSVNPVEARKSYVVPTDGRWLPLKKSVGDEEIVVLASNAEIADPIAMATSVRLGSGETRGPKYNPVADDEGGMPSDLFTYRLPYKKAP